MFQGYVRANKTLNDAIVKLESNFLKVEHSLLRREKQQELDIAIAEGQITKWLPVHESSSAVDFLFGNPVCARAITQYIWSVMEATGSKRIDVSSITRSAARLCFSGVMRAHMYVSDSDAKP